MKIKPFYHCSSTFLSSFHSFNILLSHFPILVNFWNNQFISIVNFCLTDLHWCTLRLRCFSFREAVYISSPSLSLKWYFVTLKPHLLLSLYQLCHQPSIFIGLHWAREREFTTNQQRSNNGRGGECNRIRWKAKKKMRFFNKRLLWVQTSSSISRGRHYRSACTLQVTAPWVMMKPIIRHNSADTTIGKASNALFIDFL